MNFLTCRLLSADNLVEPLLYANEQLVDTELSPDEQLCLLLVAESSDDEVIEMFYNIIRQRIIEQLGDK